MGVDVAPLARVARLVDEHASGMARVFTPQERAFCDRARGRSRHARYAAAFAGKEAVMKALGTGWRSDVEWCDIDTCSIDSRGVIVLSGGAGRVAAGQRISRVLVSLAATHTAGVATAVAEGESEE
jgi:holo-[acyl-carrier protein] synthase